MSGPHGGHPPENTGPGRAARAYAIRVRALEALLVEKGVLAQEDIERHIQYMDSRTPANGAKLVARAWADPGFKRRLLSNTKSAAIEFGIDASGPAEFITVENTPRVHNLVVCTLCSCYPRAILGRPPDWYKSFNYRARAVSEPRAVMREFGLDIPDSVEVAVHDSSADIRYMVLPARPRGTENMTEQELEQLVTRDCLIGVAIPRFEAARV